jgi:hypothetical protein
MRKTVARMTTAELRELIAEAVGVAVEQKLSELLNDPDAGKELRAGLRRRLARQLRAVAEGERGRPLAEVTRALAPKR